MRPTQKMLHAREQSRPAREPVAAGRGVLQDLYVERRKVEEKLTRLRDLASTEAGPTVIKAAQKALDKVAGARGTVSKERVAEALGRLEATAQRFSEQVNEQKRALEGRLRALDLQIEEAGGPAAERPRGRRAEVVFHVPSVRNLPERVRSRLPPEGLHLVASPEAGAAPKPEQPG